MSIKTIKCSVCSGTGVIERLANYVGYHYHQEEPIIKEGCCDECGGVGVIKIDDPIVDELDTWCKQVATNILKEMHWDYDPVRDVIKIAEIIKKDYVYKKYMETQNGA